MPDTIPNPYSRTSPYAASLTNLAKAFMSGPTEAQNIAQAETALKLQRQRQGVTDLAAAFGNFGQPGFNRNAVMSSAITGGYKPEDLAVLERYGASNTYGVNDPRTSAAFVGAGGSFGSSPQGFRENEVNQTRRTQMGIDQQKYQFDNTPITVGTPTGPVIARRSEAYGQPAVEDVGKVKGDLARRAINAPGGLATLPKVEQKFVGAEGKGQDTPRNYVAGGRNFITYDGVTDVNGQPLPPGGYLANAQGTANDVGLRPNVQGQLQSSNAALDRMNSIADYTRSLIKPQNVGVAGMVKGAAQDVLQVANGLAVGLGVKGAQDVVSDIQNRVQSGGLDPTTASNLFQFDPKLPQLSSAYHALTLTAADAIAGGVGKASDKDIKTVQGILGSPENLFANQEFLHAKLDAVREIASRMQGANNQNLRSGAPAATEPAAPAAPAAPGANVPQTPAPGAPPVASDPLGIR